jgi:hypothetical protein
MSNRTPPQLPPLNPPHLLSEISAWSINQGGGRPCFNSTTCCHGRCLCSCHHQGYPHPWPFTKHDGDEYSFFGKLANPHPEDLSPRNIDGNFISLFVGSRKCPETYPKTRKVKSFYEPLTMEKKDILGDAPPWSSAREV